MTSPDLAYFAYGSNLDPVQMAARCPGHEVLGLARLDDHALEFHGYAEVRAGAVATVVAQPGATVWGVLFRITPDHYARLDQHEACFGDDNPKSMYDRRVVQLHRLTGENVPAMTYVMRARDTGRPSRAYRDQIVSGARFHGLPVDYVEKIAAQKAVGEA